jgi:chitin disaccharide deacetylase
MLIINADDWGRSREETDAALRCFLQQRITSATAMVFMKDSKRAAALAIEHALPIGLHLNLTQAFDEPPADDGLRSSHERVRRHLAGRRAGTFLYNPALRSDFRRVYHAQHTEFVQLYGCEPSHVDGHHHKHLCMNMLADGIIPEGVKVRRSFRFWPGEKSVVNRLYRGTVDAWLMRHYRSTDYFFALSQCLTSERMARVLELARERVVELMTHPANAREADFLLSDEGHTRFSQVPAGTYAQI